MSIDAQAEADRLAQMVADGHESDAVAYVESHQGSWSADELWAVYDAIDRVKTSNMVSTGLIFTADSAATKRIEAMVPLRSYEGGAVGYLHDKLKANGVFSSDLDGNGVVDPSEQATLDAATAAYSKDLQGAGAAAPAADKMAKEAAGSDTSGYVMPAWVQQAFGGRPTDEQLDSMRKKWNDLSGDAPVSSNVELMNLLASQSPLAAIVVQETAVGVDPDFTYTWRLADGSSAQMERGDYENFAAVTGWNLDTTEVGRIVRLADQLGMSRTIAPGQKIVDWAPVGHMAQYLRTTSNLKYDSGVQRSAMGGEAARVSGVDTKANETYMSNIQKLSNMALSYNTNMTTYGGNAGMAIIATVNPTLASRLSTTPSGSWSGPDIHAANQILVDTGLMPDNSSQWGKEGYATDTGLIFDITAGTNTPSGRRSGGGGYTRTMPDPVAVKQAARDMFKSLFMAEPDEAQLQQFVQIVQSQISSAPGNQSVDASARLRDILENNALYKEFYGKSGGLSDSEYQSQFRSAGQEMLGAEAADPAAIQGGMRTGNYQTTIGQVAGSKKAWNNSTFLGRLAQAAQVINENT